MNKSTLFFGIDISKDSFDVYSDKMGLYLSYGEYYFDINIFHYYLSFVMTVLMYCK